MTPAVPVTREDAAAAQAMLEHAFRNVAPDALVDVEFADVARHFADHRLATRAPADDGLREAIEAPENGEPDPQWRAIKRAIDQFVGRVPTIGKHRAVNNAHIKSVVDRLDQSGDAEAADTIVWLCWHRALDRERERFLLDDARERLALSTQERGHGE